MKVSSYKMDMHSSQIPDQQPGAPQTPPVYVDAIPQSQYQQPYPQGYDAQAVYVQQPDSRKRANAGLIIGLAIIVAVCLISVFAIKSCSTAVGDFSNSLGLASSESSNVDSAPKVAVITLNGTIQYDGSSCSPSGLRSLLKQAQDRDDIKAVVLRVDSGGGVATAGEEMSDYIKNFSKPVVVSSASTNASAAYEISSQADYIFVAKTTAIGSIGVALQVTDLSGLYEKLGIKFENITSTESKDSSYGTRSLTDSEREWYQKMVNQIDDDFIKTVSEGRDMSVGDVRKLANGLSYTGVDAVENGLADGIGYFEDAIKKASELAGYDKSLKALSLKISNGSKLDTLLDLLGQSKEEAALKALQDKYGIS